MKIKNIIQIKSAEPRLILLLIFAFALFLRFPLADISLGGTVHSFFDRYHFEKIIRKPFFDIITSDYSISSVLINDIISHFTLNVFSDGEFNIRFPSLLFGSLTILLLYKLCKDWIGEKEALLAAFLLTVSHIHIKYSVDPLHYSSSIFFSSLAVFFFYRATNNLSLKYLFAFALIAALNSFFTLFTTSIYSFYAVALFYNDSGNLFSKKYYTKCFNMFLTLIISLCLLAYLYSVRGVSIIDNFVSKITTGQYPIEKFSIVGHDHVWKHPYIGIDINVCLDLFKMLNLNTTLGHIIYFGLALLGIVYLYKQNRKVFYFIISLLVFPLLSGQLVLANYQARYYSFVLPFYLILISCGFFQLFVLFRLKFKYIYPLFTGILLFGYLLQARGAWSEDFLLSLVGLPDLKRVNKYVSKRIKEGDIVLNCSYIVKLSSEKVSLPYGNSIQTYFKNYYKNHRLSFLVDKNNRFGIWFVTIKPLNLSKNLPFYFPLGFKPELIHKIGTAYIYFGKVDFSLPENKREALSSPFWHFVKANRLNKNGKLDEAIPYYKMFIKANKNKERAFNNLGVIFALKGNIDKAIYYFNKTIQVIEADENFQRGSNVKFINTPTNIKGGTAKLKYIVDKKNGKRFLSKHELMIYMPHLNSAPYFNLGFTYLIKYSLTADLKYLNAGKKYLKLANYYYPNREEEINETLKRILNPVNISKYKAAPLIIQNLLGIADPF
tara:strand:+ start:2436 stop:4595 length:2160 start_codon:yes stop_codon:yes gene_type:complete